MIKYLRNIKDYFLLKQSSLFDEAYYCLQYPDVRQADVDPLWHFTSFGWKEGRNPSSLFDTKNYIHENPEVLYANINPLIYYIKTGRSEVNNEVGVKSLLSNIKNSSIKKGSENFHNKLFLSTPKITVSVLTYNHENFIGDCLEGILAQRGRFRIELIIADDCSTDKTIDVIKSYLDRFRKKKNSCKTS